MSDLSILYPVAPGVGSPGLIAQPVPLHILTRQVTDSTAPDYCALFVVEDTSVDGGCTLPVSDADVACGIVVMDKTKYEGEEKTEVSVVREGHVWVTAVDTVTKGGTVYVRFAASGGLTVIGSMGGASDGGNYALTNARWGSSAVKDGLAIVELNFPETVPNP